VLQSYAELKKKVCYKEDDIDVIITSSTITDVRLIENKNTA